MTKDPTALAIGELLKCVMQSTSLKGEEKDTIGSVQVETEVGVENV